MVRSDRKRKPLGVTSFNVEVGTRKSNEELLHELAESTETTVGLGLHVVGFLDPFAVDPDDRETMDEEAGQMDDGLSDSSLDLWDLSEINMDDISDVESARDEEEDQLEWPLLIREGRKRTCIRDWYAQRAENVLWCNGPYCCAETNINRSEECTPHVYQISDDKHIIFHWNLEDIVFDSSHLNNPDFNIV